MHAAFLGYLTGSWLSSNHRYENLIVILLGTKKSIQRRYVDVCALSPQLNIEGNTLHIYTCCGQMSMLISDCDSCADSVFKYSHRSHHTWSHFEASSWVVSIQLFDSRAGARFDWEVHKCCIFVYWIVSRKLRHTRLSSPPFWLEFD